MSSLLLISVQAVWDKGVWNFDSFNWELLKYKFISDEWITSVREEVMEAWTGSYAYDVDILSLSRTCGLRQYFNVSVFFKFSLMTCIVLWSLDNGGWGNVKDCKNVWCDNKLHEHPYPMLTCMTLPLCFMLCCVSNVI